MLQIQAEHGEAYTYKKLIANIADALQPDDISRLAYQQDISVGSNQPALDLLKQLERRGRIGPTKIQNLIDALDNVNRSDLVESKIKPFVKKFPQSTRRLPSMMFMVPTVASNRTVGTFVTEDTPSLKVSAPFHHRDSPVFAESSLASRTPLFSGSLPRSLRHRHTGYYPTTFGSTAYPSSYHDHRMQDPPNIQRIGDLTITKNRKLGSGAFGVVFKGSYRQSPCAVKVLHHLATEILTDLPATGDGQEESMKAFNRECDFLKSFKHPNVVRHLATTKHPSSGQAVLVTELMDCSLKHYISNLSERFLNTRMEASICKDIASALAYIHGRSIVHRDLCGDNVLMKQVGLVPVAKISDFGMSRIIDCNTMSSTLTALGHRMGYLPPEAPLIEASRYDSSLDIFSFGVVMTQIVHRLETVKTPQDRNFHVAQIETSHPLKPLIVACLNENKEERPTACQLERDL